MLLVHVTQQRDDLYGLAKAHVIGQQTPDALGAGVVERSEPGVAFLLVVVELGLEAGREREVLEAFANWFSF